MKIVYLAFCLLLCVTMVESDAQPSARAEATRVAPPSSARPPATRPTTALPTTRATTGADSDLITSLKDHWFAAVSFLLAALGGVPGILSIIDRRRNKSRFHFNLGHIFSATRASDNRTVVLLTGTVSNDGKSPLTPAYYLLRCRIGRQRWVDFEKELIPEQFQLDRGLQIESREPLSKKDIQNYSGSIAEGQPIDGHLMFSTSGMTSDELQQAGSSDQLEMQVICHDVFGRRHVSDVDLDLSDSGPGGTLFPKQGVAFKKPQPSSGQSA